MAREESNKQHGEPNHLAYLVGVKHKERTDLLHWIEEHPRHIQNILIAMVEKLPEDEGTRIVQGIKMFPHQLEYEEAKRQSILNFHNSASFQDLIISRFSTVE